MRNYLALVLVGLAISFALPTFAQQNAMVPGRQVIEQLGVLGQKYHEAYANNDAAALAACYTWDAIIVTPQGPVYGRDAIENWYADQIERWHPKNHIDKVDPDSVRFIGTAGDAIWTNGELRETIQDPNGGPIEVKGYWSSIYVREGDTWKIRLDTYNVTPATAATPSPTANPSKTNSILIRAVTGAAAAPPLISSRALSASIERLISPLKVSTICHSHDFELYYGKSAFTGHPNFHRRRWQL